MDKVKVLCLSLWYPLAMSRYFERAMQRNPNIELKTVGAYTGSWIPWKGGMNVPEKYALSPDIPLPRESSIVDYNFVKAQLGDWKPDIVLTIDAGCHWKSKPTDGIVVHIATDPHVLNYDFQRTISDKFFNMQKVYSKDGDIYLPYAYDPTVHYSDPSIEKDYDVCLVGLAYEHRVKLVDRLRSKGIKVIFENGAIFDEYRTLNNRATIGLNWSSLDDLNARAFEIPAMGLIPVMNPVTDMFSSRHHYFSRNYIFNTSDEAIYHIEWILQNKDKAYENLNLMRSEIEGETYDARIEQVLKECGYA